MKTQNNFLWIFGGLVIAGVLLCIPFPGLSWNGRIVLATAALMATWWVTEAMPIPATALLPLVIFPLFGVLTSQQAAAPYGNHNIFLFLGGFFIAIAMERHNLHRRIALAIMLRIGTAPRRIILGFMLATAFLSMWISNTATTMIMLPIAIAVMLKMKAEGSHFATALFLGIAYSASIGGIATLVGTPPNIVLVGQMHTIFPDAPAITFAKWFPLGLSVTVLFLPLAWLYLTNIAFKLERTEELPKDFLKKELSEMGKMSVGEKTVLWVFVAVALGWIFRKNLNIGFVTIPGWSNILGVAKYVHDSTVAMLGALLLFMFPLEGGKRVLDWKDATRIPWGIVLLFGGGFSLASAFGQSGLSAWVGHLLAGLGALHPLGLIAIITVVMAALTEFTSNTATTNLMMPVLASAAVGISIDPRLLMIPAALAASCAFMFPVATPPNAIVFGSGQIKIKDMVRAGIGMNIMGVIIVTALTYFLARPLFGIAAFPIWAMPH